MPKADRLLIFATLSLLACVGIFVLVRQSESNLWRLLLTPLVLALPLWLERPDPRPNPPSPLVLGLSALAGLAVWLLAWWLMSLLNEGLEDNFGAYRVGFPLLQPWALEVAYNVLLLPLLWSALLYYGLREGLNALPSPRLGALLALYMGLLAMVTTPQGAVAFVGYGLVGALAAALSLRTASAWTGGAVLVGFMYANLAFLDELDAQLGGEALFGGAWLGSVFASAFLTLILAQSVRLRNAPRQPAPKQERPHLYGLLALGTSLFIGAMFALWELSQRGQSF